jgi:hypothetical protein
MISISIITAIAAMGKSIGNWGDFQYMQDKAEQDKLTAEQKQAQILKDAVDLARAAAEAELAKAQSIRCDRHGNLKQKIMLPCRDALAPAVVIGSDKKKYARVEDLPAGVSVYRIWKAGCEPHGKGCCQFIHPNQPEWASVQDKKRW